MRNDLRNLIEWRIKGVLFAHKLREQKRLKLARLISEATTALEDYLQDEFGNEYIAELVSLIKERTAHEKHQQSANIVPLRKGECL